MTRHVTGWYRPEFLLLALGTVLWPTDVRCEAQTYSGASIEFIAVTRSADYGHESDAPFWFVPQSSDHELIVVELRVTVGAKSVAFTHKDVALLDSNGKKHDWRKVVTVREDFSFGASPRTVQENWIRMKVLVDPVQGSLLLDEKAGRMYVGKERDLTRFLFSVPRGTAAQTLQVGKLRFELAP